MLTLNKRKKIQRIQLVKHLSRMISGSDFYWLSSSTNQISFETKNEIYFQLISCWWFIIERKREREGKKEKEYFPLYIN
jgi:hypothetical protein